MSPPRDDSGMRSAGLRTATGAAAGCGLKAKLDGTSRAARRVALAVHFELRPSASANKNLTQNLNCSEHLRISDSWYANDIILVIDDSDRCSEPHWRDMCFKLIKTLS